MRKTYHLTIVGVMAMMTICASPTYADEIDRFAIKQLNKAQSLSIKANREYCGLIGYDGVVRGN